MKSTDGGSVWTVSDTLYDNYGDIIADPNNDAIFWTGGNDWNGSQYVPVVSKTEDMGETWTQFQLSDSSGMVNCLAIHPSNPDIIFAGGYDGSFPAIFKTADGGSTWTDASSGVTSVVTSIVIDPDSTEILYAGTDAGAFKSLDGGATWTNVGLTYVNDLLVDPLIPTTIIAATNAGIFVTMNSGSDWQPMNDGLDTNVVKCLTIHPNAYLYAGTYGSGLYRIEWVLGTEEYVGDNAEKTILYAYPNPVHDHVTLSFAVNQPGHVRLTIYDVQGRLVQELIHTDVEPGSHAIDWNGKDIQGNAVAAGVYFCTLILDRRNFVEKMVVVK